MGVQAISDALQFDKIGMPEIARIPSGQRQLSSHLSRETKPVTALCLPCRFVLIFHICRHVVLFTFFCFCSRAEN